jgi:hypothetical protein
MITSFGYITKILKKKTLLLLPPPLVYLLLALENKFK